MEEAFIYLGGIAQAFHGGDPQMKTGCMCPVRASKLRDGMVFAFSPLNSRGKCCSWHIDPFRRLLRTSRLALVGAGAVPQLCCPLRTKWCMSDDLGTGGGAPQPNPCNAARGTVTPPGCAYGLPGPGRGCSSALFSRSDAIQAVRPRLPSPPPSGAGGRRWEARPWAKKKRDGYHLYYTSLRACHIETCSR
jgi:hypothetical protein